VTRPALTPTQRRIAAAVTAGAVAIAGIGFAGSYAAVRSLALDKGFGWFANVFPIGVDAGIVVLLALDLLLTWLRIPFPLLRQTAWLLTAATIAFNGAAAWPDPLGVSMHAIIPVLFIIVAEAGRHAVGRTADITADKHMESVRLTRWILAPLPTFRLWRRMKLWELRSYDEVIRMERDRLIYRAQLRARYGPGWRRKAPVEAVLPLRLTRYGAPLQPGASHEAPHGLTAVTNVSPKGEEAASPPAPAPRAEAPTLPAEIPPAGEAPAMRAGQPLEAPAMQTGTTDASFELHADEAMRLADMSKAAAVRTVHEADRAAAAPQIVARLADSGIHVTAKYVRSELSRYRKRRTASSGTGYYP
jgi:hypothetical protein